MVFYMDKHCVLYLKIKVEPCDWIWGDWCVSFLWIQLQATRVRNTCSALHEPLGFNAFSSTRFCIYNSSQKENDVMGMVRKPVMEPDAVKYNRESKTSVKVTLNTIISAGKEHTRHVEPDHQLVTWFWCKWGYLHDVFLCLAGSRVCLRGQPRGSGLPLKC